MGFIKKNIHVSWLWTNWLKSLCSFCLEKTGIFISLWAMEGRIQARKTCKAFGVKKIGLFFFFAHYIVFITIACFIQDIAPREGSPHRHR